MYYGFISQSLQEIPPKRPLPLVFIFEEMNFGGTQKQMLEVAGRLDRRFFSPKIWTLRAGDAFMDVAKKFDIPVTFLRRDAKLRTFPASLALLRHMRKEKPEIVHLCTAFPNVWGRVWGKLCGTPAIVASCRAQRNVALQHEWLLHPLAHEHICNAKSIESALVKRGISSKHVHMIHNGVDVNHFIPNPHGLVQAPHIVCVARLVEAKNHQSLLHAFALVVQHIPHATLHLYGDGPLKNALKAQARSLGIAENVFFHGDSGNIRAHLQDARLFALASRDEGTPNALLEAMACGLPVVSTNVNGIPDVVAHGKHGFLTAVDDHHALAKYMCHILTDDASCATHMGKAAREHMTTHFSLESATKHHELIYKQLCLRFSLFA